MQSFLQPSGHCREMHHPLQHHCMRIHLLKGTESVDSRRLKHTDMPSWFGIYQVPVTRDRRRVGLTSFLGCGAHQNNEKVRDSWYKTELIHVIIKMEVNESDKKLKIQYFSSSGRSLPERRCN